MAAPRPQGRMIRKDISRSKGFAKLSPKAAALFCLILPHLDSYGKSNGDPGYIKAEMCPLIPWLTVPAIKRCLAEIDRATNICWFQGEDSTWYIHATKWDEHQSIEKGKRGVDRLPSHPSVKVGDYSATTPGVVALEVEVEVEVEVKDKIKEEVEVEVQGERADARTGLDGPSASAHDRGNGGASPDPGPSPAAQQLRTDNDNPASKGKAAFVQAAILNARARIECKEWTREEAVEKLFSFYGLSLADAHAALDDEALH